MSENESDSREKCAVCGKKLKRGERRACRSCVVAVATMRAARIHGGGGLRKHSRRRL